MILYANGDSFVAGVELADDLLPGHPGYLPYFATNAEKDKNRQWIDKTYDLKHPYGREREQKRKLLNKMEYERSFPTKLARLLGCDHINRAQGGSSLDRIARTTLADLIELKEQDKDITAVIGTTCPSRSEISTPFGFSHDVDETGFRMTWDQISTTFLAGHHNEGSITAMIQYRIEHDKNYHQMVTAFKNIILISDFCKLHGIRLYWVANNIDILNQVEVERELEDCKDYKMLRQYCDLRYTTDMAKIASGMQSKDVLCPAFHYSEKVHVETAFDLFSKIAC